MTGLSLICDLDGPAVRLPAALDALGTLTAAIEDLADPGPAPADPADRLRHAGGEPAQRSEP